MNILTRNNPKNITKGDGKTALVLSGGGYPGWMYEVGCVVALDEFFEEGFTINHFDIFVGTSAGACVAALMASGVRPREIFDAIREDKKSPFNFKSSDIYSFGYQETFELLRRFSKSIMPIARYLWQNWKWLSWFDIFHIWEEFLPSGILTLKNFDLYLKSFLDGPGYTNDFRELKRELYIPAVDVDLGRYDVFGEKPFGDVPISKAVTASSAIPIIFQPVRVKGKDYIDGGVGRVAYMDIAMNHGASLILIVNPVVPIINDKTRVCLPTFYGQCGTLKEKGFTFIYEQANRISTATRIYLALRRYQAENPEINYLLIQPEPSDSLMFLHNVISFKARQEILKYGYESTVNMLKAQFPSFKSAFEKHGIKVSLKRFQ